MTSTTPGAHVWARHGRPVLSHTVPATVAPQPTVARRALCHCAVDARYARPPLRVAALRRSSRETSTGLSGADGQLSSQDRDLFPLRKGQGASRSKLIGGIRPHGTNDHPRAATRHRTQRHPHSTAPARSPSRTVAAPHAPLPAADQADPPGLTVLCIADLIEVLRRPVEFTQFTSVHRRTGARGGDSMDGKAVDLLH